MNARTFSEALGEIDGRYIEKAITYQAEKPSAARVKRKVLFPLAAAVAAILLIGSAVAVALIHGDLWRQKPSADPVEVVRSALENQAGKDYAIRIEVKSVEIDEAETSRAVERISGGPIAGWNDWSDEYLVEHFLAVKAVYDAEYDHAKTTRSDGEVTMYFYLAQDTDSGEWTIVDNSGNLTWSEDAPPGESGDPAAESIEEQLFAYLSELFNEAYSPYYDGLHYEISSYEETIDGGKVTATFLWTKYYLVKGWDVPQDEGVEQASNYMLQATAAVREDGTLDLDTISVFSNMNSPRGEWVFDVPIEEMFPG